MRGLLQAPFILSVLLLVPVVAQRGTTSKSLDKGLPHSSKFKSVQLEGQYTVQVPEDFAVKRIGGASPSYAFVAPSPQYTTVQVVVMRRAGIMLMDEKTGRFRMPVQCDGALPPLTDYFRISGNREAYYGWRVTDYAYECTMNSPCPLPTPPESRYMTEYAFAVLDEQYCVEFTAMHFGSSGKVTGFEGDGKLLRDVIVPSLSLRH